MRRILTSALLLGLAAAACAKRLPDDARRSRLPQHVSVREYEIPWPDAFPSDVVIDTAGRLWFTDRLTHVIGIFDPATERFASYRTPTPRSAPYGIITAPDGGLWYAASGAGQLGRVDPATGDIVEVTVAGRGGPHLLAWHEGRIWFSQREARSYGSYDPATGDVRLHALDVRPYGVAAAGGSIWISVYESEKLLRIDPATAAATVHDLSLLGADGGGAAGRPARVRAPARGEVRRIAAGPDGLWFTDFQRGSVTRYDADANSLSAYPSLERRSYPYGIAVTKGGLVWYGERGTDQIVVFDPAAEERLRIALPTPGAFVRHLAIDEARRRVWAPLSDRGRIALIRYR
jgi:virginiamycin B lyase